GSPLVAEPNTHDDLPVGALDTVEGGRPGIQNVLDGKTLRAPHEVVGRRGVVVVKVEGEWRIEAAEVELGRDREDEREVLAPHVADHGVVGRKEDGAGVVVDQVHVYVGATAEVTVPITVGVIRVKDRG